MKRIPVKSSNIKAVGYDPKVKTLEVEFKSLSGPSVYQYENVPEALYQSFMSSESKGQFFDLHIKKGGFRFTKMPANGGRKRAAKTATKGRKNVKAPTTEPT
jgi:tellurite resistance-related uncharacterized protein